MSCLFTLNIELIGDEQRKGKRQMKLKVRVSFIIAVTLLLIVFSNIVAFAQDTSAVTCTSYQQAPSLDAQVAAGTLPAVADRLPKNPVVDIPFEGIGMYGGTMLDLYGGQRLAEFRLYGYENLVRWNPAVPRSSRTSPNVGHQQWGQGIRLPPP